MCRHFLLFALSKCPCMLNAAKKKQPDRLLLKSNDHMSKYLQDRASDPRHIETVVWSDEFQKLYTVSSPTPRHLVMTEKTIYLFRTFLVGMAMPKDFPKPGDYTNATREIPLSEIDGLVMNQQTCEFVIRPTSVCGQKYIHGRFRDEDVCLYFAQALKDQYFKLMRESLDDKIAFVNDKSLSKYESTKASSSLVSRDAHTSNDIIEIPDSNTGNSAPETSSTGGCVVS